MPIGTFLRAGLCKGTCAPHINGAMPSLTASMPSLAARAVKEGSSSFGKTAKFPTHRQCSLFLFEVTSKLCKGTWAPHINGACRLIQHDVPSKRAHLASVKLPCAQETVFLVHFRSDRQHVVVRVWNTPRAPFSLSLSPSLGDIGHESYVYCSYNEKGASEPIFAFSFNQLTIDGEWNTAR